MPKVEHIAPASALAGFHEPVAAWFNASFEAPTRPQQLGWPAIQSGQSTLILAPTGTGKTLAAFLVAIDRLMFEPVPHKDERCRVLYISPLKALAVDVEKNLRAPLVGISRYAERMGAEHYVPEIAIRTGDTPPRERAAFLRNPSDIFITTPESLYLVLTSRTREVLRSVRTVIIDEIHAMVGTKRGAHLALSLERLEELTGAPLQRIGLSATQRPLEEVARFLGGFRDQRDEREERDDLVEAAEELLEPEPLHPTPDTRHPRAVTIVDAGQSKTLDLLVEVPVEDMAKIGEVVDIPSGDASQAETRSSIWPAIHPLILDLIRSHRSTLIFVNSRRLAERLATALNELAGEEIVHAHHGSIAREQRLRIEDELKSCALPAMVATSSLELGIDMGAIDLVIQVEAPPSVASGIQRIGRAGHHIGAASKGIIIPKYRGDLLACAALTERMEQGAVEKMRYLRNPLDILAQQIVAMVAMDGWRVEDLERVIRRAAPFAELSRSLLEQVLDMLSGRYPSDEFAELRPRITWDRLADVLHSREGAKRIAITNGGTIPDRGLYGVFLLGAEKGKGRVGELDEEMVFESKVGDTIILGASTWKVEEITHDRVIVSPSPGQAGRMPFWHGERASRPLEFGRAIGALTRTLRSMPAREAVELLKDRHSLDENAAVNLLQYLHDQEEATGVVPDDRMLVIESYLDEMGDWRVCILSPFGGKVHAPWAMAIGAMIRQRFDYDVDILWTDNGIVVRLPEADEPPPIEWFLPDPDDVEDLVIRQLSIGGGGAHEDTQGAPVNALFASRFREAAARALLLPRKHPGQRAPMWQQRKRAADLLKATTRFGSFPIILETFRECLKDVFDMPALVELLREIQNRTIRAVPVVSRTPSPYASALMFNYVANFIYEGDAPLAERRAQALLVDPSQLRELLGESELRELLDPDALDTLEAYLQHLSPERAAKHPDGLHDLFLRLGDLTLEELIARCDGGPPSPPAPLPSKGEGSRAPLSHSDGRGVGGEGAVSGDESGAWLRQLVDQRRIIHLTIAGEPRYIAAEEAGRYRDAFGIPPPPGLPTAFLEYGVDPLGDIVSRYARTHGPFTPEEIAARYAIGIAPVLTDLEKLETKGRVVQGEFRPGRSGREWCDTGVLRALRQKSLARLRHEVEPVEPEALARFELEWQTVKHWAVGSRQSETNPKSKIQNPKSSHSSLLQIVEQLQDAPIPASVLESQVLPARIPGYDPRALDELFSSGEVVWVGREAIGQHDGRISLYLADHLPLFMADSSGLGARGSELNDPVHVAIRVHLQQRGASFYAQILQAVGGYPGDVLNALWDLVWAGEITNDTLQPLRAYQNPKRLGLLPKAPQVRRRPVIRGFRPASQISGVSPARSAPPEASGRWSLVSSLAWSDATPTERATARAQQLLTTYGVVTREGVQALGVEGGFSAVYSILKAMEDAGRVRRGYFVSGLGATQFAMPGAVDRLRALREPPENPQYVLLAATDPANPYGAAVPWPERPEGRRPARAAGASVLLLDGKLAAWLSRSERDLLTFLECVEAHETDELCARIAFALAVEVESGRRRSFFIETVDGLPVDRSPLADAMKAAGFNNTRKGYIKRAGP